MDKFFPHLMQSDTTSTHDTDSSISFALRKIWSCKSQHIKVISKGHNMEVKKCGTSPIIDINRIISGRIPAVSWLSNICMPINQNLNLFRMRIRKSSLCWLGKEETPQRAIWKSLNANHFLQRFLYSLSSELLVRYVFNIQTQILEKKKKKQYNNYQVIIFKNSICSYLYFDMQKNYKYMNIENTIDSDKNNTLSIDGIYQDCQIL